MLLCFYGVTWEQGGPRYWCVDYSMAESGEKGWKNLFFFCTSHFCPILSPLWDVMKVHVIAVLMEFKVSFVSLQLNI